MKAIIPGVSLISIRHGSSDVIKNPFSVFFSFNISLVLIYCLCGCEFDMPRCSKLCNGFASGVVPATPLEFLALGASELRSAANRRAFRFGFEVKGIEFGSDDLGFGKFSHVFEWRETGQ